MNSSNTINHYIHPTPPPPSAYALWVYNNFVYQNNVMNMSCVQDILDDSSSTDSILSVETTINNNN